jgi:hypothetical protein
MQRTIEAPDQEWLTEVEAAAYLRVNSLLFSRLVELGWVVGERRLSGKVTLYPWEGIWVAQQRIKLGDVPPPPQRGKSPKKKSLGSLGGGSAELAPET